MRLLTTFAVFAAMGVSALAMPPVPRPAKEFDFVDASGKHVLLSSLKGKVVIIQGLLTTCPHCQAFSQILSKMQTEYGPRGFQAMGIGMDADPTSVTNYITTYHVNFPVAYAPSDTLLSFLGHSALERLMVPQVVIIDKKGVIQAESAASGTAELQTEANIRVWIEKLLGPATRSKATPPAAKPPSGN
jgi:peroxiredoxin